MDAVQKIAVRGLAEKSEIPRSERRAARRLRARQRDDPRLIIHRLREARLDSAARARFMGCL
jgi:hypothetical protein